MCVCVCTFYRYQGKFFRFLQFGRGSYSSIKTREVGYKNPFRPFEGIPWMCPVQVRCHAGLGVCWAGQKARLGMFSWTVVKERLPSLLLTLSSPPTSPPISLPSLPLSAPLSHFPSLPLPSMLACPLMAMTGVLTGVC